VIEVQGYKTIKIRENGHQTFWIRGQQSDILT